MPLEDSLIAWYISGDEDYELFHLRVKQTIQQAQEEALQEAVEYLKEQGFISSSDSLQQMITSRKTSSS